MRTPGRCTNLEGCWISASHRDVWLSVGEEFVCPNCGGMLSPPPPRPRSFRGVKRAAVVGTAAMMGLAAVSIGVVKLSNVSWTSRATPVLAAQSPENQPASAPAERQAAPGQVADATVRGKPEYYSTDRATREIVAAKPSSIIAMQGISAFNASERAARPRGQGNAAPGVGPRGAAAAAPAGPLMLYRAGQENTAAADSARAIQNFDRGQTAAGGEQQADATINAVRTPLVTFVSQASLAPAAAVQQRPVVLPINFGQPQAPETDVEPVSAHWRHHGIVKARTDFLPGPAAASVRAKPASVDAIAQICRIPSLMH